MMINNKFTLKFISGHPYFLAFICLIVVMCFFNVSFVGAVTDEYVEHCSSDSIKKQYEEAGCWSCDIVLTLLQAMGDIVKVLERPFIELGELILVLGGAIWYALYFLKALGSFNAQDPSKIVDGALLFGFKLGFVYILVSQGIDTLTHYIVNPLLSIGYDIGQNFLVMSGGGF